MNDFIMNYNRLKRFFPFLIIVSVIAYFLYLVLDVVALINTLSLKHTSGQRTAAANKNGNNNINSDDEDDDDKDDKLLIKKSTDKIVSFISYSSILQ